MTQSRGFARIRLSSVRWLLPWIGVLFVSATMTHAVSSAIVGGAPASDQQLEVQGALSPGEAPAAMVLEPATSATPDGSVAAKPCSGIGGGARQVGVDDSSGQRIARDSANAPSSHFRIHGTRPASTGHASSDGLYVGL